jgi:hypothetical protein
MPGIAALNVCLEGKGRKNEMKRLIVILLALSITLSACGLDLFSPIKTGNYLCMGSEFGLGATAGALVIEGNGVARFKSYYGPVTEGQWSYDRGSRTVSFSGDLPLIQAEHDPDGDTLSVDVEPGRVTHAESGHISCSPTDEWLPFASESLQD